MSQVTYVGSFPLRDDARIFLQRRSPDRPKFPGRWDLVGGQIEAGESWRDALAREISEETGWMLDDVVEQVGEYAWSNSPHREAVYLVTVAGPLDSPTLETDKNDAAGWFDSRQVALMRESDPENLVLEWAVEALDRVQRAD